MTNASTASRCADSVLRRCAPASNSITTGAASATSPRIVASRRRPTDPRGVRMASMQAFVSSIYRIGQRSQGSVIGDCGSRSSSIPSVRSSIWRSRCRHSSSDRVGRTSNVIRTSAPGAPTSTPSKLTFPALSALAFTWKVVIVILRSLDLLSHSSHRPARRYSRHNSAHRSR